MKKITVALTVASVFTSGVFAGEYGFRDFMLDHERNFMSLDENKTGFIGEKNVQAIASYCDIKGGDISLTISNRLGSQILKLHTDANRNKILAMTRDERIAKFGKSGDYDTDYNQAFVDADKDNMYNGVYECKSPDGQKFFSATQNFGSWVVKHSPELIVDRVHYSTYTGGKDSNFMGYTTRKGKSTDIKAKLDTEYPTYESFFDDWNNGIMNKLKKTKQGQNYEFEKTFSFFNKFDLQNSQNELTEVQYFCEAKHGEFLKDGMPYREFISRSYQGGGLINRDFKGTYACTNTAESFTLSLDGYTLRQGNTLNYFFDDAIVKKGVAKDVFANKKQESGISSIDMNLLHLAALTKQSATDTDGLTVHTVVYEGKDSSGCDLAYIEKHITTIPNSSETFKYKSCNGEISLRN